MRGIASRHLPARQRGAALLILLALVTVVITYTIVAGLNRSTSEMAQAREQKTYAALAQAKEALINYAITYKDTHDDPGNSKYTVPGYLPCPDLGPTSNVEGTAAQNCGGFLASAMGRLPWQTLGLDVLKDSSGECLWYAVSGTYKNSPNGVTSNNATATSATSNNLMNWDTNGQFNVMDANGISFLAGSTDETSADTRAVAVIFAPGSSLPGQDRTRFPGTSNCGGNFNAVPPAAAYLETANGINNSTLVTPSSPTSVTDISSFIAGTGSNTFNDKLVYITRADIWNAIKKRSDFNNYLRALTRRAAECTTMYGINNGAGLSDKRLPWASSVPMAYLSYYAVDRRYRDVTATLSGRLSYRVSVSDASAVTNNLLSTNSDLGLGGIYLLTNGSYCSYFPEEKIWYDNWKDHLFYAVANEYKPSASPATAPCTSATCLKINGDLVNLYAAVVIFAGEKLSGQSRNTLSDKKLISNYLEGRNASNHPNGGGNGDYEADATRSVNGIVTFNDIVYGIDSNLRVRCHPPTNGTMMLQNSMPQTGILASAPAPLSPPGVPNTPPGPVGPYAACP